MLTGYALAEYGRLRRDELLQEAERTRLLAAAPSERRLWAATRMVMRSLGHLTPGAALVEDGEA